MFALVPRLALALTFGQAEPAPAPAADLASQLRECDAALGQRKSELARACYEALRLSHPGTPEAHDAERALMMMSLMPPLVPALTPPQGPGWDPSKTGFYVVEPYSAHTNERLRLTTWEKLDFGISGFIFGLSTGFSFAGASDAENPLAPMAAGALIYTGLAALYVNTAKIDRGDLPLVLAISLYIPSTAGLIALATETESPRAAGAAIVGAGLVALPLAYWAAASTDLDPGDTQLVRDAGFWGAVWGVSAALSVDRVEERTVGVAGLVGLYGGLGLGLLAASTSDVSLERVRVTTWGGYGGAVVGGLIAAGTEAEVSGAFRDMAVGSALGVLVTFMSTGSIDAIPPTPTWTGSRSPRCATSSRRCCQSWSGTAGPSQGWGSI